VRFILEVFAAFRAMELLTILNRCHRLRGFVYQHARFSADHKSIEVAVRPRKGLGRDVYRNGSIVKHDHERERSCFRSACLKSVSDIAVYRPQPASA